MADIRIQGKFHSAAANGILADARQIQDGFLTVDTLDDLSNLSSAIKTQVGVTVYVVENNGFYRYEGDELTGSWVRQSIGAIYNITSLDIVYDGIGSSSSGSHILPTSGVSNGTVYYCYNPNASGSDLDLATALQWSTGFLAQASVDNSTVTWELSIVCSFHTLYIDIATDSLYRYTDVVQPDGTKLIRVGGASVTYPTEQEIKNIIWR